VSANGREQRHTGVVACLGLTNVGKSTLINRLIGQKLVIVSPKPQTTSRRLRGIVNAPGGQFVIVDTPGLHAAEQAINRSLLAEARRGDIVTFLSAAGLPARAVLTPWLRRYLAREQKLRAAASPACAQCPSRTECLTHCGFKDGNPAAGQFCIEVQLAAAQRGNIEQGLFFRGSEALPFGSQIRKVRELLEFLLAGKMPSGQPVAA